MADTKLCRTCHKELPVDSFYKGGSGRARPDCKECQKAAQRQKTAALRQRDLSTAVSKVEKTCNVCGLTKPASDFWINLSFPDGLQSLCKVCSHKKNERYFEKHPGYRSRTSKRWRQANPERHRELAKRWREANPEKFKQMIHEIYMRWSRTEKGKATIGRRVERTRISGKRAAYSAARRSLQVAATPPWVEMDAIYEIYAEAAALSERDESPWHVDHIDPLSHRLVCGLHVALNLQAVPAIDNLRKSNSFKPYRIDGYGNFYELYRGEWILSGE